ncbi:MAG: hypothetical protein MJ252_31155 [archaeon]|nr:hypothetical protein [archaeon]
MKYQIISLLLIGLIFSSFESGLRTDSENNVEEQRKEDAPAKKGEKLGQGGKGKPPMGKGAKPGPGGKAPMGKKGKDFLKNAINKKKGLSMQGSKKAFLPGYTNSPFYSLSKTFFKPIPVEDLFSIKCDVDTVKADQKALKLSKTSEGTSKNAKVEGLDVYTNKEYGFGDSAYFFDYLDNTLRDAVLDDFQEMFNEALKIVPWDNCTEIRNSQKTVKGITYCQLERIFVEWRWMTSENAKNTFLQFNFDGDEVLNPREFIIMSIELNQRVFQENEVSCDHCLFDSAMIIREVFNGIDYCNKGRITAKEIWDVMRYLTMHQEKDIYKCPLYNYRTPAINDFVLKSTTKKNIGYLTTANFIRGILLGYWNRQTDNYGFITGDERNKSEERWEGKVSDRICEQIATARGVPIQPGFRYSK